MDEEMKYPEDYGCVREDGYQHGLTGDCEPEDNPYDYQTLERYEWGEGFFDGYKSFLKGISSDGPRESL